MRVSEVLQTSARIPRPDVNLIEDGPTMAPAHELGKWARETLLFSGSEIYNPEHEHLADATIGFLWAFVPNKSQGRKIAGTAQLGQPSGKPWPRARSEQQLVDWFGEIPDFLITIDAVWAFEHASDLELCAVCDHELYHCWYVTGEDGLPIPNGNTGGYQWFIRGHDVEEFVGVVRRYGAWSRDLREMKEALNSEPELAEIDIRGACGVCLGV
jgi:hypothetical protein